MCGISALFCLQGQCDPNNIITMTNCVRHRGPDDEGYVFFSLEEGQYKSYCIAGNETPPAVKAAGLPYTPSCSSVHMPEQAVIALGHRRLSIIDLSPSGHQPMCSHSLRYWIVFNGEIYNYPELKRELESLGHTFVSRSDTEVILASYAQWGKDCLHKLNGMWAFIIFDSYSGVLFAARDRFGIKPLYYWYSPAGYLVFGSEIKQFTVLPGWKPLVNGQRAYEFLNYGLTDHTHETVFQGVFQIPGGWALECRVDELKRELPVYQWYTLDIKPFRGSYQEACKTFLTLFSDSIRIHLHADVPVGSCLSGGLDSSSIVCMVNEILKEKQDTELQKVFSARSEDPALDEYHYILEVVKSRNIQSHVVFPNINDLMNNLDDLIWHNDEPFESTSIFAQSKVFQLASDNNIKVMLDGQGGDEILAGYHYLFKVYFAELLKLGKIFRFFKEEQEFKKNHGYDLKRDYSGVLYYVLPDIFRDLIMRNYQSFINPPWINRDKVSFKPGYPIEPPKYTGSLINEISKVLVSTKSLPALLHYEDRDSMTHSVEARVPFLDYRLVEFAISLPTEFKIGSGLTKKILRDALASILPEKILKRMDKIGFATAEEKWMRESPDTFRKLLSDAIVASQGILNENALIHYDKMIRGEEPFSRLPWRWICFGIWMKKFEVKVQ
ncbi:MAG TPA: asparagine synthase (glutamine-hydrolyzing) [Methanolinea sp.]|nr:asparagine synthase (glutamine-hydrolyzing) [Methanolinea sp.]HRU80696.1 asparagine synthase (glutamine-hydrolyzing) [Methanolinea sp.]